MPMAQHNKNCVDCAYRGSISGVYVHCAYIFATGHKRPCPPGDECTVKVGCRRRHYPKKGKKTNG